MIYPSLWWSKPRCPRNPTTTANFVECSMRLFTKLLVKKFAFEISEDIAILMTSGSRGRLGTTIHGCQAHSKVFLFVRVRVERGLSCVFHGVYSFRNKKRGLGEEGVLKHSLSSLLSPLRIFLCFKGATIA